MRRAALALPVAAALPIAFVFAACGNQEWSFYDPMATSPAEASLDADAGLEDEPTFDAADGDAMRDDGEAADGACDPDASRCPVSCAGGVPCPASAPVCTQPHAICQPCYSNQDCSDVRSGPVCTQSGTCAPECNSDRSCPGSRPRCARSIGRCVRCLNDADCPSGDVCVSSSLSCEPAHNP
jgi:hypothetical protein